MREPKANRTGQTVTRNHLYFYITIYIITPAAAIGRPRGRVFDNQHPVRKKGRMPPVRRTPECLATRFKELRREVRKCGRTGKGVRSLRSFTGGGPNKSAAWTCQEDGRSTYANRLKSTHSVSRRLAQLPKHPNMPCKRLMAPWNDLRRNGHRSRENPHVVRLRHKPRIAS